MSQLDMACAALKRALLNQSAIQRYTIMHDAKYQHPGWVELMNKKRGTK